MYSIAVSVAVWVVTGLLVGLRYNVYAAIITGLMAGLLVFYFLLRRFTGRFQEIQTRAYKLLETQKPVAGKQPDKAAVMKKIDEAIEVLKEGLQYRQWMLMGESQINGQIGYFYYLKQDFDQALPYLKSSFMRNWMAQAMLAAHYHRTKDVAEAKKVLERAIPVNKQTPILYGLQAWIFQQEGDTDGVLKALSTGVTANPGSEELKASLVEVQNGKKFSMSRFGEMWWQFYLEQPPQQVRVQHPPYPMPRMRRR